MLMALVPLSTAGNSTILFYLISYLFTNLGAFACVAMLRNQTGSENLDDLAGAVHRAPVTVVALTVCLLSLLGMPPLAGFAAKFQVFAVLYDSGRHAGAFPILQYAYFGLLALAALNTVVSAGYYLKVLRVLILDAPSHEEIPKTAEPRAVWYLALLAGLVVAVGLFWNPLVEVSHQAAEALQPPPRLR